MRNLRQGRVEFGMCLIAVAPLTIGRQTFVDFCQAFYAPNCICRDRSAHRHSCPYFCCSMTNKYCIVSSTGDKYTFDLSNLVDLPEHLTRHSNRYAPQLPHSHYRSFFKRPFWLSISTSSTISKCLHIFVIPPSLVLKPKSYKSFVATRCFVELSTIPSPLSIYENDFGVIGVLGTDFGSFFTIRNVMRKFAFVPTTGALKRGYPVFWSIIKDVVQNWKRVRLCNLNVQNAAESPGSPTETLGHSTDAEETSKGTTFGKESVQRSPVVRITSHIQTSSPIRSSPILPASPELPEPFSTTLPKLNTENAPATGQTKLRQAVSIKLNPFHSPSGSGENTSLSGSHSFCDSGSGDDMSHTEPVDSQPTQPILAGVADFSYGGDGGFGDDEPWLVPSIPPFFPTESGPANNTSSPSSQTYRVEAIEDEDQAPQSPPLSSFHQSSAETTEGVAQGDETGAITDDSLTDLWLETLVRLPFDLSRTTNREVPLQIQSLMELTAKLLCARQNARATDWSKLWAIHREDTPGDVISYNASFDGQVQAGLRLVLLLLQGENSSPSYKLCAYGCSKGGVHRWISNTM